MLFMCRMCVIFLFLMLCIFVCASGTVCRPRCGPVGPVGGVSCAALQRILRFSQRELRERPQPAGTRAPQRHHRRQLTRFLHFPPRKRCEFFLRCRFADVAALLCVCVRNLHCVNVRPHSHLWIFHQIVLHSI